MHEDHIIETVLSRDPPTILSKIECYTFYERGLFGNRALTWRSYQEIVESGWTGGVCMRSRDKYIDRKGVHYDLQIEEVPAVIEKWKKQGISESQIGFNQSLPNERILIQGELKNTPVGLRLYYSTIKKPMNLALAEERKYADRSQVSVLFRDFLFPESYDEVMSLLERFPDDAIEFGSYECCVGNLPNRNTLIWEVRGY